MIVAGGVAAIFAFGILGFLAWTLSSIQSQNIYLADRLDTYTSGVTKTSSQNEGQVAGAETVASVLPPEAETTRKKVESVVIVPVAGDIPTFALIDNLAKVQNEAFFAKAQVGDHLFVYPKSKMAILYRPSALKIVNLADISNSNQQNEKTQQPAQSQSEPNQSQKISSEKNNGKNIKLLVVYPQGSTTDVQNIAKEKALRVQNIELSDKEAVSMSDSVTKNRIVNISGSQKTANELLSTFDAEEGQLPSGISADGADIVLVLAKDR